ncbi:MAG: heme b synthase [Deltaproteobacteria bacterium]|nr:heme b synthase [Deltaproteobacteria bacterium]MBW2024000.1 heme b synthase [Deltaproteobacteria bacterium]MBW2125018.1 heme b synthase [Deltaproteobacteria bacterium]
MDMTSHPAHMHSVKSNQLRLVAWEVTRSCNLNCVHCRAAAEKGPYPGELDTERCLQILDEIALVGKPIVILTGGEPLLRGDIFKLAEEGTEKGLRMVMATNGTLLTEFLVRRMKDAGIKRVSISIDGATASQHDAFRKVDGAFDAAMSGIELLRKGAMPFQINTTVTRHNVNQIDEIMELAVGLGAVAHHLFLLVPTGRARELADQEVDAEEYERLLRWFYHMRDKVPLYLKATCAPQYYRILRQEAHAKGERVDFQTYGLDAVTRGCLGGTSFCFISHDGVVQPCGYLELNCGDVKQDPFHKVWNESPIFAQLRDYSNYKGKCGQCEYIRVCGGCRARAYEATGDFLAEEPLCSYQPKKGMRHG